MTRLTSKGQVTIPKDIRDKLGIGPGSDIGFHEEGGQVLIVAENKSQIPAKNAGEAHGDYLIRALRELGKYRVQDELSGQTTDEIMEDLRGYSDDANDPGFKRHS
jgi:AbrB family looped-hinge helix DNA binding protein